MKRKYSVKTKLIAIICLAILPLNIINLIFAGFFVHNYKNTIMLTYQGEVNHYCKLLDQWKEHLDYDIKVKSEERESLFVNMEKYDYQTRDSFHVIDDLSEILYRYDMLSMAYVKYKNQMTTVIHNRLHCDEYARYEAKKYLKKYKFEYGQKIFPVNFGNEDYIVINYYKDEINYGYIIRISELINTFCFENNHADWNIKIYKNAADINTTENMKDRYICPLFNEQFLFDCLLKNDNLQSSLYRIWFLTVVIAIVTLISAPVVWNVVHREVIQPLNNIGTAMKFVENKDYRFRMAEDSPNIEFLEVEKAFNTMVEEITNLKIEAYENELEIKDIEATNLRLQTNPHFLLNSLNMIYSLCKSKNISLIQNFTQYLAEYVRYSLWTKGSFVILKQELECVESYLEIQKIRFPQKFYSVYQVEENLENRKIPTFLLINFVENAIKYGIDMDSVIEIIISIHGDKDNLYITITDTGNGMSEERLEKLNRGEIIEDETGKHIGIWNCRRRLHVLYGENAELTITSKPKSGTQVFIRLTEGENEDAAVDC